MIRDTATAVRTARNESSREGVGAARSAMGRGLNPISARHARGCPFVRLASRHGMAEIRRTPGGPRMSVALVALADAVLLASPQAEQPAPSAPPVQAAPAAPAPAAAAPAPAAAAPAAPAPS